MSRIYLDACIIIHVVEKHTDYSYEIEKQLAFQSEAEFCYSPLARLECLVKPFRIKDYRLLKLFEDFFSAQTLLTMHPAVFDRAAHVRADFNSLKTPDALHISTATFHKCDEFWTNDDRLNKINPNLVKNILAG